MSGGDTPLVAGPIYGLREWNVVGRGPDERLTGPFSGTAWPPHKPMKAICAVSAHSVPGGGCGCGLYGWHPRAESARTVLHDAGKVGGIVAAWGEVEVHAAGFRARYARPHTLVIPRHAGREQAERVRRLARRYGIRVLVASPEELLAHCRARNLGLDEHAAAELVAPVRALAEKRRHRAERRAKTGQALTTAAAVALFATAVGFWPSISGAVSAWLRTPPAVVPADTRYLRVIAQHTFDTDDGTLIYFAVVRNEHPTKVALGVFAAGTLRRRDGTVVAALGSRLEVEHRPLIAPGDTAVVVDEIPHEPEIPGAVTEYRTFPLARAFRRGVDRPPVIVTRPRIDARRCLVTATVRSDRARLSASTLVLAFDRRGRPSWGSWDDIGPLPAGRSSQVLERMDPAGCLRPPARVKVFPRLSYAQVIRPARRR